MARELKKYQLIERSITKKYRRELWNPFIEAVKSYSLIKENDVIGVELLGDSRTALTAKLLQQLCKISDTPFALEVVDKSGINISTELNIPTVDAFSDNIVMTGTNCFTDVIKTVLNAIFFEGTIKTILPSDDGKINPLYCIKAEHITAWANYNSLQFNDEITEDKIDAVLNDLKQDNPDVEHSIFKSLHAVCLDTIPAYTKNGISHSFTDKYLL